MIGRDILSATSSDKAQKLAAEIGTPATAALDNRDAVQRAEAWGSYGHFFTKPPPPPVMRGTLNLAMADFASPDSRGRRAAKATAKLATDVATSVADLLTEQLRPTASRMRIEIRGPAQFPQIRGASQTARAQAAKQRAGQIDADIVVYGTLSTDGNTISLQPELYLSDSIQGDTGELVGDHPWGSIIELLGSPESNPLATQLFGEPLSARTKALASMILGIWHYQAGQPSAALQHLHAAAENPAWRDQQGKQVVYLFLGNAAERQGAQEQRKRIPTLTPSAGPSPRRSATTRRPCASIGSMRVPGMASPKPGSSRSVSAANPTEPTARCWRRLSATSSRDRATHRPTLANLDAKIAFGLGRAQICMTLAGVADRRAQAQEQLNIAIRAFQQNPSGDPSNRRLREIAAEAYAQRGLLATTYANTPDARAYDLRAVEDYKQAIALSADRPQRQPVFYDNLADIYNRLHLPRDAEEARNKARSLKATGHTAYG